MANFKRILKSIMLPLGVAALLIVAAVAVASETRLTTDSRDQSNPSISGARVVWEDARSGQSEIYSRAFGGSVQRLTNFSGPDRFPRIDGNKVVFQRDPGGGSDDGDIYLYDFANGQTTAIATGSNFQYRPDVSGNRVVWYEYRGALAWEVMLKDLSTGQTHVLSKAFDDQFNPRISGDMVVWQDGRNGNYDIYYYDLSVNTDGDALPNYADTDTPSPDPAESVLVALPSSQQSPDVDGTKVVWADKRHGNLDIYSYDIANAGAGQKRLTTNSKTQHAPAINGNLVSWTDYRNGDLFTSTNADIYAYNLVSLGKYRLTTNVKNQKHSAISGTTVVYDDNRNGDTDIYHYDMSELISPLGTIKINNGAAYTRTRGVTLNLSATSRSGSPISHMRFKNQGGSWSAWEPYKTTRGWTLTSYKGNKRVYAKYKDSAGNVSSEKNDLIFYDPVAPKVSLTAPFVSTRVSKTTTFKISWGGADPSPASGMDFYTVRYRPANSSTWINWKVKTRSTYAYFKGSMGRTYFFRVKGFDKAGNYGWSPLRKTTVPYNEGANLKGKRGFGGYQKSSKTKYFASSVRYSYGAGHYMVYRVANTNGIGLVTTKYKNRGRARIYVDGKLATTVDAHSSKFKPRQLIFYRGFKKKGTHYIKIVNLGTPGRARFDIDAVVGVR